MSSAQAVNAVLDVVMDRVAASLPGKGGPRSEKLTRQFNEEPARSVLEEFIREPEVQTVYIFFEAGEKLGVSLTPAMKKKGVFLLKSPRIQDVLKLDDFKQDVICCEITEQTLSNMSLTAHEIYFPLLSNPANRAGWSGPTAKDVMLKMSAFLSQCTMTVGQAKGQTLLPSPPPEAFDEDNLVEKERVHLLETAVVQWANKIQAVLATDPEQAIKQGAHPGPFQEMDFWTAKAADLSSLSEQLASERMRAVLETLQEMKSPFGAQFEKLSGEVRAAKEEALENARFLRTLKPYFTRLTDDGDFTRIEPVFLPMLHCILLIFKHSNTYNTKLRLSCLIQEICNALVSQGARAVSGELLFRTIEEDNPSEGVQHLKATMNVIHAFKKAFFRYQAKAMRELTEPAWDTQQEILFARLDLFLERCADLSEFLKIVLEFSKLGKIFLGGTKGKALTAALRHIHDDFTKAVESFKQVPYDVMDINASRFDDDFYRYRCEVKELDRRLAAVLVQGFDDAATLSARFKLLESFEGLLERPIIKDELDKKQAVLMDSYVADLRHVQEFFHAHKANPRIDQNMPPVAGALAWCRSLTTRVEEPLEKFKQYTTGPGGVEREEVKEIERVQRSILQQLHDYEAKKILDWSKEIDQTSQDKLRQPLLRRDRDSRLLHVNFDDALVRLLREVKYFLLLRIQVPAPALTIFEKAETYRQQIGNLDAIVNMYNEMMLTLHQVERPLVEKDVTHIDEVIEPGMSILNWQSLNVNPFIQEAMDTVSAVYKQVKVMKDNLAAIKKMMADYAAQPLADRKNKPLSPADFEENLRKLWLSRHSLIAEHQETVTKLLLETNQALNVNKGSPIWRAYVEYVQDSVRDGLANTIINSIRFLAEQLDPANIEKSGLAPLLEIKLGLYANDVLFNAEDGSSAAQQAAAAAANAAGGNSLSLLQSGSALDGVGVVARKSRRDVWQIVNDWCEGFFEIGNIMTRADGSHYVSDLKKNDGIVRFINLLKKHLDWNQKECESYRQEYIKFEFLWKTDRNAEFTKFLQAAMAEQKAANPNAAASAPKDGDDAPKDDGDDDDSDKDASAEDQIGEVLPLEKFEEKILYYREIAAEIGEKKSPVEIGWLKVNAQPIKVALTTWVQRWIHTYTSFLYNDVTRKLSQLEALMKEVNTGLLAEVSPGDSATLKKVLGYIHAVRSKEKSTLKLFGPLRDSVSLLKKYGKALDEYELKLLSDAPMKWDSTVNNVYKTKEKVNNLQNVEVDKIKAKVEAFEHELKEFRREFKENAPFSFDHDPPEAYDLIYEFHKKINAMEEKAAKLTDLEKVFELNVSKHRQIKKNRQENKLLKGVWDLISVVTHQFDDWKKTLWDRIDTDSLLMQCKKLQRQIMQMPVEVQSWDCYTGLVGEVKNLLTVLPLVNLLHSPCMEDRHWRELKIATGKHFSKGPDFCLSHLLDLELHKYVSEVEYIVELATKESKIAGQLKRIESQWSGLELQFGTSAKGDVGVIQRPDDILATLEENMAALQGMQGQGKYVEHFITEVNKWQRLLNQAETVLYDWLEVQSKWSSLEAIFMGSKDIRVQLPEDSERFDEIDRDWRALMANAKNTPNVIEACSTDNRSERLQALNTGLSMCEKSLFQYLETKRKSFPRFYFLSNAALLDLLSFGHDPQAVQKHLGDCFDNIAKLEFTTEPHPTDASLPPVPTKTAIGMYSKEGEEYVPLASDFACQGAVEEWLNRLVTAMKSTLMEILSKAKFTADHWEVDKPRQRWLFDYPAQIALTASQIIWTEEVNSQFEAFGDGNEQAMKEYSKTLAARLEALISLVLGELNARDRIKIITLITVDVHNRDVVQKLIDTKTQDYSAFAWQSQMRMKWRADTKQCAIKVADASFNYSYEYVGNTGRLVITPLTDRCYITLTQALRLIMGGAPAGPAGTGKTETTKDLGRAMGLPVYVFNCSEQMNVQSLGSIFKGLCQTGAWGCFDEFNRIPIEVLSVVSTQVSCILNAIREKRAEFDFMGEIVKLIPAVGVFITMNPGYAGRTELPENLKTLFRSCAMVTPDMDLICENMLMSEGFLQAHRLSKKFTTLYSLSSELLSKQRHYDWGLRATKAVLRVAGSLKRAEPRVDEDRILMRALRDFNLPKLVDEDKPIFRELIGDLFPGLGNTERKFDQKLQEAIVSVAGQRGLQADETFVLKAVELAELLAIRHSVFVIGPAGCGKSEIWKTLLGAFRLQGIKCAFEVINPKAIRNNELYGWLSKTDWHDGVLSTVMRNMSRNRPPFTEEQKVKWLVLDGDIDPNWIESLNTVMDDNKMLTLVSNERIPLTPSMRMMFEISNLDNATPATVSRAGILFINAKDVGSKPFLDSWIERRENDKEKSSLLALFNKYTTPEFLHEMLQFARIIPVSEVNMIRTLCYLLEGLLGRISDAKKKKVGAPHAAGAPADAVAGAADLSPAVEKELFEANFVYACIWAFGGATLVDKAADHRKEFSDWWRRVFTTIKFPKEGHVFDYFPDPKTGKMVPWAGVLPQWHAPDDAYLVTKVFVPTLETVRQHSLLDLMVERRRQVLLVGSAGTGKTVQVDQYLHSMNENMLYCTINLNFYTDAKALQHIMEGPIDKRSGRIFGPPGTKRLVYFIDDLNMPQVDIYNTQSPSCLLKQHMDYGSWYDTSKLEKKEVQDVQYLAAMNPTAGSFTVDPRLQGLFATFACLLPSKKTLSYIYTEVLQHHFTPFGAAIGELVPKLIKATIELHDSVALKFIPSTRKFHYNFNLRDLSAVFQGLCLAQSGEGYTPKMVAQLWQHEVTRVFSDRLVSPADEQVFEQLLESKLKQYFKDQLLVKKSVTEGEGGASAGDKKGDESPLIFTSFMAGATPVYLPAENMAELKQVLEDKLSIYNDSNPVMNLEMFNVAIQHVCRIARIIENPRGNALLVGVGGSGKQSLAKLASFICGYDVFQISVTQSYGLQDLRVDLQNLYLKAGTKGVPISFLLTDTQIVDDAWLVYINDFLSSGNIPDLFNAEDKDMILSSIRNEAKAAGVPDSREALYEFFINSVRTNLHMILCFSPVGEKFRVRCRKFPALINCSVLDWFHPWSFDSLVAVARRFLSDLDTTMGKAPQGADQVAVQQSLAEHMAQVHLSVNDASEQYRLLERRYNYTTPKSFLELIAFYKTLLNKKRAELAKQTHRLEKGIETLKQTHVQVAGLKEDLTKTLVRVGEKAEAAAVLISKMGVERKKVEEQQGLAAIEAAKAKTVSEVANKISEECREDLEKALPILERAKNAVDCLSKASLTTLKSFAQPPGNVIYVSNAVMILKNIPGKRDWAGAKKMMKDISRFLDELKSFDATSIDEATLKKLQPILEKDFFNEKEMKSASEAAANLCSWVVNVVEYSNVYKNVAPKIAAQKKAAEEFDMAQAKLKVVEERVAAMQAKLKSVTDALKDATDEKNAVEAEAQSCQDRLGLAKRLVEGLADENIRWTKSIASFQEREMTLVGDSMLAAAFVSYIGAFNQKFRLGLWKDLWIPDLTNRNIPLTAQVDPLMVLASDSDFAKWKNEGLAADRASLENGAIITSASRWPLLIDPQLVGVKWIRQRLAKDLKVIQFSHKRWLQTLLNAVSSGEPVLLESVGEELDATIDPIMSRSVIQRSSGAKIIKIGSDEVSFNDNFRLYLQTKLTNPHYRPEIAAQTSLVNFIVTEEGLEDQLLALVVNKEKPELEERRTGLVRAINDYMVSLTDLENELLERLSSADADNILRDTALVEGLEKTKQASTEIEQKVELAKKQELSINTARNEFRLVSSEGAWLYFLLIQLVLIDHMYQFSLQAFVSFFMKAMGRARAADTTKERVVALRESIRITVFTWTSRGLFERHKLIFSSQLCFKLQQKGALRDLFKWDAAQYDYLIRGSKKLGVEKHSQLDWLPLNAWYGIQKLIELPGFEKLAADMLASPNRFKEWFNKPRPESTPLPLEWRKLDEQSPFMKLLVVRAMRPDRMTIAMENYVKDALPNGTAYIECDAGKSFMDVLTMSLDDSSPVTPIFFVLSPGSDPVHSVEILAKRNGVLSDKLHRVALGQGQDVVAMSRLEIAHKEGGWVVLENIHLMPLWNVELEKKLDEFAAAGSHPDFRLFISAEPSEGIPNGILERSIKLTNEPPQGLKQNLKRAFASFEKDEFEFKDPKVKSIIFGLCHFHSVIIERTKYGAKGWNKSYPFNIGDLMCSAVVLANYLEAGSSADKVPWSDLRYIFGDILYGGHITDNFDRLLCSEYLSFFMREDLLDEMEMFPFNESFPEERFRSPPVLPYDQYFEYIDQEMKAESPVAFGLHPNAEIAVKTKQASELFTYILDLQPRSSSAAVGDSVASPQAVVQMLIQQVLNDKAKGIDGIGFNLEDIAAAVVDERGPYQNVFLLECERMNILCREMRRSLKELDLGLSGELQMSERMEDLFNSLYLGRVPASWTKLAYPSQRSLSSWMDNLIARAGQLQSWVEEPASIPLVVQITYMFNPQSFLTAIMQKTAQKQKLELDKLVIQTDVTRKTVEQTDARARDGAYIYGLYMEGARWNWNSGLMEESLPREMACALPVICARAVLVDKQEKNGVFRCPVYKTQRRGDSYVFTAGLRTKAPSTKWTLAGVVLVMEVEE